MDTGSFFPFAILRLAVVAVRRMGDVYDVMLSDRSVIEWRASSGPPPRLGSMYEFAWPIQRRAA